MTIHEEKAVELFKKGYNCSQSVFVAFCDIMNIDEETALRLSSSFGGGMGRLREVCGAVTGMFMVAGILYGYSDSDNNEEKKLHYARIQSLAGEFKELNGSYICRELLSGISFDSSPNPTPRTDGFYKKRPCVELVGQAAAIMDKYISENEIKL